MSKYFSLCTAVRLLVGFDVSIKLKHLAVEKIAHQSYNNFIEIMFSTELLSPSLLRRTVKL